MAAELQTEEVIRAVRVGPDPRVARSMRRVAAWLRLHGHEVEPLDVPPSGLPARLGRDKRKLWRRFAATPHPLLEAWRVAQHLERLTEPGDLVLLSDRAGIGGIFALSEAMRSAERRRRVWSLGADSTLLRLAVMAGTYEGAEGDMASAVDWEIAQYRSSERVLAASTAAARHLEPLAAAVTTVALPAEPAPPPQQAVEGLQVWAPEPVARSSQTGQILRAISGLVEEGLDPTVVLSPEDSEDGVWTGTTWDALSNERAALGNERVSRAFTAPDDRTVVVLGDLYAAPPEEVKGARARGIPIVAARGSAAAADFPGSFTWQSEDDLAQVLTTLARRGTPQEVSSSWDSAPTIVSPSPRLQRAERISVGVPLFREVGYLDECIDSVVGQKLPPAELILFDDGSRSQSVAAAVERWQQRRPDLVRTMRQPNRGVCAARNAMLAAMRGDAFLFIDSDDVLHPAFLEQCAEALQWNPDLWAVATWTEFFGEYEAVEAKPPFDARIGMRENPIVSTGALVDMKVREEGIRFAPDLAFLYCEDWHFWSQITAAGGAFGLIPEPLIRHRVHEASGASRRSDLAHTLGRARATAPLRGG